ncbi:MAG: SEC-C domain-containing protein [Chitinophagales bacterium]|nr:hypothetical protein [Bacteroidota bacterium]
MLFTINLTSNRSFQIRNFEEDKIATLKANKGLRYVGKVKDFFKFSGNFYLTNPQGDLIESFEIVILIGKAYPNVFPIVVLIDDKIEKNEDNHMSVDGIICFEHDYITNAISKSGLRLYDFANYYLPKYFSWVLVKKYGAAQNLQEWAHGDEGTKQFYETLLGTTNKNTVRLFLENYCKAPKINRNDKCFCGNEKKLKHCHLEAAYYLKATSKQNISKDIALFAISINPSDN